MMANGHTYIVIESIIVRVDGYSSDWHVFDGISNIEPSDSIWNASLSILSKCLMEQAAGKQIPSEMLGPMSNLMGNITNSTSIPLVDSHHDHILSKIQMWNGFFRREFQLANAVLCSVIVSVAFDIETL